jgi:hypothetical protein
MPDMQVNISDTRMWMGPNITWNYVWPIAWEYVSLTVIPLGTNENLQILGEWVTSDAAGNRNLYFTVRNNSANPTYFFATLTLPASSVA